MQSPQVFQHLPVTTPTAELMRLRFRHCCRPLLSEAKSSLQSVRRRPQFPSKARNSLTARLKSYDETNLLLPVAPTFFFGNRLLGAKASNSAAPTCATHDTQSTAVYRVNRIARVAGLPHVLSSHTAEQNAVCSRRHLKHQERVQGKSAAPQNTGNPWSVDFAHEHLGHLAFLLRFKHQG